MVKNSPAMQETWVRSPCQEDPVEKAMQSTPVFLPGEFHGQTMGSQSVRHNWATITFLFSSVR